MSAPGPRPRWSTHEDSVIQQGAAGGLEWDTIAEHLPGRTADATRNRYHRLKKGIQDNYEPSACAHQSAAAPPFVCRRTCGPELSTIHAPGAWPQLQKKARKNVARWTSTEDEFINEAVRVFGQKWRKLAALMPGRSDSSIRNRWQRLQTDIPGQNLDMPPPPTTQAAEARGTTTHAAEARGATSVGPTPSAPCGAAGSVHPQVGGVISGFSVATPCPPSVVVAFPWPIGEPDAAAKRARLEIPGGSAFAAPAAPTHTASPFPFARPCTGDIISINPFPSAPPDRQPPGSQPPGSCAAATRVPARPARQESTPLVGPLADSERFLQDLFAGARPPRPPPRPPHSPRHLAPSRCRPPGVSGAGGSSTLALTVGIPLHVSQTKAWGRALIGWTRGPSPSFPPAPRPTAPPPCRGLPSSPARCPRRRCPRRRCPRHLRPTQAPSPLPWR